ncbi:hypothetical protein [Jatrophihabitans fulvus]
MAPGLTDEQIAQLRDEVSAGKSPRVRIAGPQFDTGAVRSVGDPAVDGNDYVTVRVKVDGVTDDLRFAPRELSRGKDAPAKRASKKTPARAGATPARRRETAPVTRATPEPAAAARPARPRRKAAAAPAAPAAPAPAAPAASAARRPTASETTAKRGGRKTAPGASVTITLKSAGTSWTVSAQRGAKSVAKNVDVNPGVVSAVAGLLQVPSLDEAVAAVNDAARVEAEARAEQLRAELARIESVLDSHRLP